VPKELHQKGHVDTEYPAEVRFQGPARAFEAEPVFLAESGRCAETFCHGGYFVGGRPSGGSHPEPEWTSQDDQVASCTGCHGMPPPSPHPPESRCSDCHKNIGPGEQFSHPELHVNGVVNFFLPSP
jgi:predicted CxxxxCH...CXXCH cytochrome family protein